MITIFEPVAGQVVALPAHDARCAYLRLQDAAPVPLTLAVKEHLRGTPVRCQDAPGQPWYCGDCLAGLLADPEAQDAHQCGAGPQPGDLAWYAGPLPDGYGRLYEVTRVQPGRVRLHDMGHVLMAHPGHVTVVRRAEERAAHLAERKAS